MKGVFEDKEQQRSVIRHYCKVCNRGFGCPGALGGHMRAHVMGDVSTNNGNESFSVKNHPENDNNSNNNNKHPYFLRAKTPRSFIFYKTTDDLDLDEENMKPSVQKHQKVSPLSSPSYRKMSDYYDDRHSASSEEEDLANCLVMLSNESYALPTNNKEENNKEKDVADQKGMFQCKACKKKFNSHQALGGHRASHKKVKGCFAAKTNGTNEEENMDGDSVVLPEDDVHDFSTPSDPSESTLKTPKVHECSVCRRVFSSGQALGGHKRCHWLTTSTDNAFIPNFHYDHQSQEIFKKPMYIKNDHDVNYPRLKLDLNLNLLDPQQWSNAKDHNPHKLESMLVESNSEKACEKKLKNMSDLTSLEFDGGWLQVGIASSAGTY